MTCVVRNTAAVCGLAIILGILAILPLTSGCSESSGLNMNVRKPANERPDLDAAMVAAGVRRIPADEGFNLTSFTSGQAGDSRGRAESAGNDGAIAAAEARDGGTAWGEFQLGYCFDNALGTPLQATIRLRMKVATATSALSKEETNRGHAGSAEQARSILAFFVKDTSGLVLRKETLQESDLEKGAESATRTHDLVYDVRLEAGRGYYLVIGGRVDAHAEADQTVSCVISVNEAALEIHWKPLPDAAIAAPLPQGAGLTTTTAAAE